MFVGISYDLSGGCKGFPKSDLLGRTANIGIVSQSALGLSSREPGVRTAAMLSDSIRKRRVAARSSGGVSEDSFLANVRKFQCLQLSPNTAFKHLRAEPGRSGFKFFSSTNQKQITKRARQYEQLHQNIRVCAVWGIPCGTAIACSGSSRRVHDRRVVSAGHQHADSRTGSYARDYRCWPHRRATWRQRLVGDSGHF